MAICVRSTPLNLTVEVVSPLKYMKLQFTVNGLMDLTLHLDPCTPVQCSLLQCIASPHFYKPSSIHNIAPLTLNITCYILISEKASRV